MHRVYIIFLFVHRPSHAMWGWNSTSWPETLRPLRLLGAPTLWRSRKEEIWRGWEEMDGPFHRPHAYHRWWVDQLLLQSRKAQAGRHLCQQEEDDEDPLDEAIYAQRMRLSKEEVCNLWDIIPPRADFVGVPFVTRLTSTMVDRHEIVCYTDCTNLMIYIYVLYCYTYKCKLSDDMLSVESNDMLCGI